MPTSPQSEISSALGPRTPTPEDESVHRPVVVIPTSVASEEAIKMPIAAAAGPKLETPTVQRFEEILQGSGPGTPEGTKASVGRRSYEECLELFESNTRNVTSMTDEEVILLAQHGKIPAYALEKVLGDLERAVIVRRALICE